MLLVSPVNADAAEFGLRDHVGILHVAAIDQRGVAIQHHHIVDPFQMQLRLCDLVAIHDRGLERARP